MSNFNWVFWFTNTYLSTNKIIGIHKSYAIKNHKESYNLGTLLKYPLIDMNKKIEKMLYAQK